MKAELAPTALTVIGSEFDDDFNLGSAPAYDGERLFFSRSDPLFDDEEGHVRADRRLIGLVDGAAVVLAENATERRLFCFADAGGGPPVYARWPQGLPGDVEVAAVQLPARGSRLHEPPILDMAELVEWLVEALAPQLDRPFAFFGHCLGCPLPAGRADVVPRAWAGGWREGAALPEAPARQVRPRTSPARAARSSRRTTR